MNDLRKRAEDLLTRVELTPEAVDAMVAFAAERVAAERDAIKETAERNKWMQEEIARLRELLQQIVQHHDEAMLAAVGDEANYHQMRKNQVLFHLPPNAQDKAATAAMQHDHLDDEAILRRFRRKFTALAAQNAAP